MRTTPPTGKRAFACALVMGTIGVLVAPEVAQAHFVLSEPPAWMSQDSLGLPEKTGPCGDEYDDSGIATPTNIVTAYQQGQTITVTINETIFHPGHYRIALAVNSRAELPADPDAQTRDSDKGPWSVSAPIASSVKIPVLADGLFVHTSKQADPWETDVTLPNINCPHCTLQITQFMAEHGYNKDGGYYYHHCADLAITADPSKPVDSRWPAAK